MSVLGDLFKKQKKLPEDTDPEVEDARRRRRLALANASGRQSTITKGIQPISDINLNSPSLASPNANATLGPV